jgi:hypothetical protein
MCRATERRQQLAKLILASREDGSREISRNEHMTPMHPSRPRTARDCPQERGGHCHYSSLEEVCFVYRRFPVESSAATARLHPSGLQHRFSGQPQVDAPLKPLFTSHQLNYKIGIISFEAHRSNIPTKTQTNFGSQSFGLCVQSGLEGQGSENGMLVSAD